MQDLLKSPYARIFAPPSILKTLVLVSLIGSLSIGITFWIANGIQETSVSLLILSTVCLGLLLLQDRVDYQLSGLILYLVISVVLTFNVSVGHAIYDEAMLAYPILIIFAGLVFGKRSTVVVTGITIVQIILVYNLAKAGYVQVFDGAIEITIEETIITLIILIATGFFVWVVVDIIENAVDQIQQSENELENAYDETLAAWARALELGGREIPGHSARVAALSTQLAERLNLDPLLIKQVRQGALLHDIGKIGIPEQILLKESPFDAAEAETLKEHTALARNILMDIDYLSSALDVVSHHHERYDGTGYPAQLKGNDIPISAQVFSVVDHWDILRSDRPCRKAWSDQRALKYLREQSGKKFNPKIVSVFTAILTAADFEVDE